MERELMPELNYAYGQLNRHMSEAERRYWASSSSGVRPDLLRSFLQLFHIDDKQKKPPKWETTIASINDWSARVGRSGAKREALFNTKVNIYFQKRKGRHVYLSK
jgi:hypothetical protein